jgi:hypothetical protein
VVSASASGVAGAQGEPPNPGASSVAQYVELVPTAGGPKAPGIGDERRTPLPPIAKRALDKASESTADSLETVATSSNYGAPPAPRLGASERVVRDDVSSVPAPSLDRTLQAIAAATSPVGDARLIGLLAILAVVTVGGAVLALQRPVG